MKMTHISAAAAVALLVTALGAPMVLAQSNPPPTSQPAPRSGPGMMDSGNMDHSGMMDMSQMNRMMENCNRMMEGMQHSPSRSPNMKPDNG